MQLCLLPVLNETFCCMQPLSTGLQSPCHCQATIQLYQAIVADLLPTPARCHYTFNLRDVSKVFQGILKVKARSCQREDTMTKLWAHEAARCFHDRLINAGDKVNYHKQGYAL